MSTETVVSECLSALRPDPWRASIGFSDDLLATSSAMDRSPASGKDLLAAWLQRFQPCLFGRMAAQKGMLHYCILTEEDLHQPDAMIRDQIQAARLSWRRSAMDGVSSGFIILALSQSLAAAVPDETVATLARKIGSLYLLTAVAHDSVFHEDVDLQIPGRNPQVRRWKAGVNYFAAHGDKRWWQDHRIPGGIGLSVNSVGHMAKAGLLATMLRSYEESLGIAPDPGARTRITSLSDALEFAMRTIDKASDGASGKATQLLPLEPDSDERCVPTCPVKLPAPFDQRSYCEYKGLYHTDYTLPSEYFRPEVERPNNLPDHYLDFSYLYLSNPNNPDHETMGAGVQVRSDSSMGRGNTRGPDRGEGYLLAGKEAEAALRSVGK